MSTRRIRAHVNPLRSTLLNLPLPQLDLSDGTPIDVELGSAEAHLLMELAEQEAPGRRYFGLELRQEKVRRANLEARRRGLPHVVSLYANLSVDLPRLFPAGRVSRFFLYFPDPWFKSWQHKRRVIEPALVEAMLHTLTPGGEIHFATDIFALALDALASLEAEADRGRLRNRAGSWRFTRQAPVRARSRRERQCEADGTRIWRLCFDRP